MNHQITIPIPVSLKASEFEIKMTLAAKLYELGKISSGEGAEMFGVSVFGYDVEDIEKDAGQI